MAELSVQIGADIKDLQKKLNSAEKSLKSIEKVSSKSGGKLSKSLQNASKGVDKFEKSTANAVPATQEFSRIIQDAPFGIQGVANNITQLTDQFGNLTRKTGSSGAALKAMLGTLSGPAGILLAVSTVTSLLVSYGDKLKFAADEMDGLAKETAKYVADAKTEITTLETLLRVARDEANSKTVRKGAIEEINKKYSKYLGNLDLETVKTDAVTKSVNALTQSLILKAKIQGIEALITEKTSDASEDIIDAELKRTEALKKLNSVVEEAISNNKSLSDKLTNVKGEKARIKAVLELYNTYGSIGSQTNAFEAAVSVFKNADKDVKSLNKELSDSILKLVELQKESTIKKISTESSIGSVDDGAVIIKGTKKTNDKKLKADKAYAERKRKLFASIDNDLNKFEEESVNDFIKRWESVQINVDPFDGSSIQINDEFQKIIDAENRLIENSRIMSDVVGSSFGALSNQIADELSTGNAVFDAFTQSLLSNFAQIAAAGLQSLITEKLIGTGKNQINRGVSSANAITVATSAAAALGPAGVFALPGLITSQLALVNGAFAGVGAFAKGGFSGDDNLAFLNKNELVLRPFEQAALFNVLKGTGLSGVSNNTRSDEGGIMGEVVLRGQNQVIQLRRAEKRSKRFYNS